MSQDYYTCIVFITIYKTYDFYGFVIHIVMLFTGFVRQNLL